MQKSGVFLLRTASDSLLDAASATTSNPALVKAEINPERISA
jgi:hypothetical protein